MGSWVLYKIMMTEISDGTTSLSICLPSKKGPGVQDEVTILNPVAMKQASDTPLWASRISIRRLKFYARYMGGGGRKEDFICNDLVVLVFVGFVK